jgi:hypothetical protein
MHAGDLRLKYDIPTIDPIIAGIDREYQGCNSCYPADIYAPGKTSVAQSYDLYEITESGGKERVLWGWGSEISARDIMPYLKNWWEIYGDRIGEHRSHIQLRDSMNLLRFSSKLGL